MRLTDACRVRIATKDSKDQVGLKGAALPREGVSKAGVTLIVIIDTDGEVVGRMTVEEFDRNGLRNINTYNLDRIYIEKETKDEEAPYETGALADQRRRGHLPR